MAVIFPDIEKVVVAYLASALSATAYSGTRVATKRAQPDQAQPSRQVIINAAYNAERDFVLKSATLTIDVYADDYASASELALLIESLIRGIVGSPIMQATVLLGPVRRSDDTKQELRSIDVALVVKGSN